MSVYSLVGGGRRGGQGGGRPRGSPSGAADGSIGLQCYPGQMCAHTLCWITSSNVVALARYEWWSQRSKLTHMACIVNQLGALVYWWGTAAGIVMTAPFSPMYALALGIRSCLTAVCSALVNPAGMHYRVPYTIYACICMCAKDQYTCINDYSNISWIM